MYTSMPTSFFSIREGLLGGFWYLSIPVNQRRTYGPNCGKYLARIWISK